MSDNDKVHRGEMIPPGSQVPASTQQGHEVLIPKTGAMLFPYLRLKTTKTLWDAYSEYLGSVEQAHIKNAMLNDAIVANKRSIAKLGRVHQILEEDRLDWEEQRAVAKHERNIAKLDREIEAAEKDRQHAEATADGSSLEQNVAEMRLKVEKARLEVDEAEHLFDKKAITLAERESRIEQAASSVDNQKIGQMMYDAAFDERVARRGGKENLTDVDKTELAAIQDAFRSFKDIAQDFSDGTK